MGASRRQASAHYRWRSRERGLARLEVQAPRQDGDLIKAVAEILRGDDEGKAAEMRLALLRALDDARLGPRTALDLFASDLPDHVFEGIFDRPSGDGWRNVDL